MPTTPPPARPRSPPMQGDESPATRPRTEAPPLPPPTPTPAQDRTPPDLPSPPATRQRTDDDATRVQRLLDQAFSGNIATTIAAVTAEMKVIEEPRHEAAELMEEEATRQARQQHLAKLKRFDAVEEVPRSSAMTRPITTRWVDRKTEHEVNSRLTVHGFKQAVDPGASFSSGTPAAPSLRILLAVAAKGSLLVGVGDSQSAFLQAPLQEDVWVEPPAEAGVRSDL